MMPLQPSPSRLTNAGRFGKMTATNRNGQHQPVRASKSPRQSRLPSSARGLPRPPQPTLDAIAEYSAGNRQRGASKRHRAPRRFQGRRRVLIDEGFSTAASSGS